MLPGPTTSPAPGPPDEHLALVGGTIYVSPTEDPTVDGVVVIQRGKITAVGSREGVRIPQIVPSLDCSGLTITAGFWNSHVHFFERKWANADTIPVSELSRQIQDTLLRFGFTSVFDLSSMWKNTRRIRDRIESGEVPGPRVRSTGEGLVPPGALPSGSVLDAMGVMKTPLPEIADAAQAADACKKLLNEGVDGIKLFPSSPRSSSLPVGAIQAAVSEAHRLEKPVFIHPNSVVDIVTAARIGVDVIAHTTPHSGPWDETVLATMKQRRVALTPTLTLWKSSTRHDRISAQELTTRTAVGQLRAWAASGGSVLFGTDLGAVDSDPTEEYVLMTEAGMSFRQILASLTTAPSDRFGDSKELGRVATGLQADLVVLKGNPSENIRALAAVQYTLRAGKIIYRASQ